MKTAQQFALTFVVLSLLGSRASAAITSTDEIFTRITTGSFVTDDAGPAASITAVDYDGDGWPDIYFGNGADVPTFQANFLWRNNGDGTFARTNVVGVATDPGKTVEAAWGDYDNDGFPDLVVVNWPGGKNFQYRNNGDGTFTKITQGPIVTEAGEFIGCVWGDYDRDGWLDLFVTMFAGNHRLYHNNRDGTFSRTTDLPTAGSGVSPSFVDYDNDGFPDLFVAGWPSSKNALYHNNGGRSFTRITNIPPATEGRHSVSTTWGDYDNDGFADLFVANGNFDNGQYQNFLYHNGGDGTFAKVTTGPIATDTGDSGGSAWADVDNDGDLDLFVTGMGGQNELFYLNNGDGTFTQITLGNLVNSGGRNAGAVFADYDRDGFLDLFVSNTEHNWLFRNKGNSNGWLAVKCIGTVSNRSAIGAKVRAKATIGGKTFWQLREISTGDGRGNGTLTAHFGLGDATIIDTLRIEWPSGIVQELHDVATKQSLTVTEPARLQALGAGVLRIQSWKGMVFELQSSTNLVQWLPVTTVTNLTGTLEFTDPDAANHLRRFYRTLLR